MSITVDYDALASLRSLLTSRGDELQESGAELRSVAAVQNADVSAGQLALEQLWGSALTLLNKSLELTATNVGDGITIYQQGDRSVAAEMSGPAPSVGSPMQAAV